MDRASLQERFGIIGQSEGIRHVLDRIRQVARTEITVLIQGESGTGKELFAQAIHQMSERRRKPVLMVNCGAIPEGLIESELFGNEKGAYTGAVERRHGYFEEANGSSLVLDEIGEMPLTAQVRLLRVLETGQFSRVGSSSTLKTDVRVIAATNKDLGQEVRANRFREDLYYRLSTVIIQVPPLRERRDDILTLFEHFQRRFAEQYNTPRRTLDDSARQLLLRYRWPGNVRELRNVAEQTAVLLKGDRISADDVRPYLRGVTAGGGDIGMLPVAAGPQHADGEGRERELIYRALMELRAELRDVREEISSLAAGVRGAAGAGGTIPRRSAIVVHRDADRDDFSSLIEDVPFEIEGDFPGAEGSPREQDMTVPGPDAPLPTLEDAERRLIAEALGRFDGNRRQTAKALGISERTLYRKLKELDDAHA
jgi:DNA-binding NtrC family response regulator